MPETEPLIEKDGSRLFAEVSQEAYAAAYKQLRKMRKHHPEYRDDQLLMRLLCWHIAGEGNPER